MPLFNSGPQLTDDDLDALKAKAKLFQSPDLAPQLNFGGQAGPQAAPQMPQQAPAMPSPQQAPQNDSAAQASVAQANAPTKKTLDKPMDPSLKQRLFGYSNADLLPANSTNLTDEYGLQKPTKQHAGILSTIAKYALPALTGLTRGVGILPGITAAYAGSDKQDLQQQGLNQANYNTARTQALASERQKNLENFQNRDLKIKENEAPIKNQLLKADIGLKGAEAAKAGERSLLQQGADAVGNIFRHPQAGKGGATPPAKQSQSSGRPQGAVGTAPAPDGKMHYHDKQGNDLGAV